jgi:hypothetical protein
MDSAIIVQIILTIGGIGVAFLGGLFSRRTRHVSAEVTLSVEAREWAKSFEERARAAEARAFAAEQSSIETARRANTLQDRMTEMERHIDRLVDFMIRQGIEPPKFTLP